MQLPKIPNLATDYLSLVPSEQEIRRTVMTLGPDKAPGPDGFNARLLQTHWDLFGSAVVQQVQ